MASPKVMSPTGFRKWQKHVEALRAEYERLRRVALETNRLFRAEPTGRHQLRREDATAAAWMARLDWRAAVAVVVEVRPFGDRLSPAAIERRKARGQ